MTSDATAGPLRITHSAHVARRLATYTRPYRSRLALACAASLVNKALDLAPPLLIAWAIDAVTGHPPAPLRALAGGTAGQVVWLGALTAVIFVLESLFQWAYQYGFMTLAQKVQHDVRVDAYEHLQTLEMAYFEDRRTGELLSVVNDDVNQLERFLNTGLNDILQLAFLVGIAAILLGGHDVRLTAIGLAPTPFILWGVLAFRRRLAPRYRAVREKVGDLSARLQNNLGGMAVIQAFTAEAREGGRLREESEKYREDATRVVRLAALFTPLIRMAVAAGFVGVIWAGGVLVLRNEITVGEYSLFMLMIQRLLWPLTRTGEILNDYE
ncbi:MAG: ABC transporter ATP-binding protein, partial [Planctomycetes bacterium]|nr:ABC transporter ATP-binding protein [Planctomycetota bacterium]